MIIIKLWGGLCNQMFQYSFGYSLSKRMNDEVYFDLAFYDNQPRYVGKRAVMNNELFPNLNIQSVKRPVIIRPFENKYVSHVLRHNTGINFSISDIHFFMERLLTRDMAKYYSNVPYKKQLVNYYDGYWQSSQYFEDFESDIRYFFTPGDGIIESVKKWKDSIGSVSMVAVHVRRGDYVIPRNLRKNSLSVVGRDDYYNNSISELLDCLTNPIFCFFSDDIQWCRETFGKGDFKKVFVDNKGPNAAIMDLFSIASCEHGIMSQSTFSWWGNWLRENKDNSYVICPKNGLTNERFAEKHFILR